MELKEDMLEARVEKDVTGNKKRWREGALCETMYKDGP